MATKWTQRQELLNGAETRPEPLINNVGPTDVGQYNSTDQIVELAEKTHEDTTKVLRNGVKVVNEIATGTAELNRTLDQQGEQLRRVDRQIKEVKHKLTYAEKLLAYMRQWCCCGDPELRKEKDWVEETKRAHKEEERAERQPAGKAPLSQQAEKYMVRGDADDGDNSGQRGNAYRQPDTSGLHGLYDSAAMRIEAETRQQDTYLDEISRGLEAIKDNQMMFREKLVQEQSTIDEITHEAEATGTRVGKINNNSQLRQHHGKRR